MNILEKHDKSFTYTSIIFNISLAVQAYLLWKTPNISDVNKIYTLTILMAFEFIMVHSGVLMAVVSKEISIYIFFPFYGLFALVMNASVKGNTILILYLVVVINRMRFAFADVSKDLKNKSTLMSIFAAMAWFILMFIVAFNSEKIPTLGLTEEFITMSGYNEVKKSSGLLPDMPHVALFFAVLYYIALALIELFLIKAFSTKYIKNVLNKKNIN